MTTLTIEIANRINRPFDQSRMVDVVRSIVQDHGFENGEISIAVVDDVEMRELNRTYLDHDYETDVLSFVMQSDPDQQMLCGQLILSLDTATREAARLAISPGDELLFYAVHGALHLTGYRDKSAEEASEMRAAEAKYLNQVDVKHVWPDGTDHGDDGGREVAV